MVRKSTIILFNVLLMAVMPSIANGTPSVEDLQESCEFFVKYVYIIHENFLENMHILRNVLNDSKILQVTTAAMKEKIAELTKLVKGLEVFENDQQEYDPYIQAISRFSGFRTLEDAILKYTEPDSVPPTTEDQLIKASLLTHGYEKARAKLLQRFAEYTIEMINIVDRNIAKLSDEAKIKYETRIATHNQVKSETNDIAKKYKIFSDSLPAYGYNISEFH